MSAIWDMDFSPVEKLVLLALADWANDDGVAWPSIVQLAKKTGCGERTVQRTLRQAEINGLLVRKEVTGKGCSYRIDPRHAGTPATKSPVPESAPTPATLAPNTPVHTIPQKTASSSRKRATGLPANFHPVMSGKTAATVDGWPPGRLDDELEHFAAHHLAKGTTSFDWQASWRTWVVNSKKWEPRHGTIQRSGGQPSRTGDGFLNAINDAADRRRANDDRGMFGAARMG
jgi:hypothetical protein